MKFPTEWEWIVMDWENNTPRRELIVARFTTDIRNNDVITRFFGGFADPGNSYPFIIMRPQEGWDWGKG